MKSLGRGRLMCSDYRCEMERTGFKGVGDGGNEISVVEVYKWRWAHGMGIIVKDLCEVMGVKRVEREEKFTKSLGRGRLMCSDYRCEMERTGFKGVGDGGNEI